MIKFSAPILVFCSLISSRSPSSQRRSTSQTHKSHSINTESRCRTRTRRSTTTRRHRPRSTTRGPQSRLGQLTTIPWRRTRTSRTLRNPFLPTKIPSSKHLRSNQIQNIPEPIGELILHRAIGVIIHIPIDLHRAIHNRLNLIIIAAPPHAHAILSACFVRDVLRLVDDGVCRAVVGPGAIL